MGRKPRIWQPNDFYHIVCRGNRRDALFKEEDDFLTYLYMLRNIFERYPFELTSYCLMTNHIHLQMRSKDQTISKVMSLINKRYADYYNTKNRVTGHVFEKRYYDKIITTSEGLLETSKYIHLNPVEAHMVKQPGDYRWSSYRHYEGTPTAHTPFLNMTILLDYFSGTRAEKMGKYCAYLASEGSAKC
ncbi:REP-associated tyrosine transposase [Salipaludibacillus daqingensis]|uniref:REP-associated tyrosine transposase n=1 Tax=Salipaludibacillus daqingensis TaxID=3041001 RepID=UPI0024731945|nr:transposase [Salipaludibacillus daqingensis]